MHLIVPSCQWSASAVINAPLIDIQGIDDVLQRGDFLPRSLIAVMV